MHYICSKCLKSNYILQIIFNVKLLELQRKSSKTVTDNLQKLMYVDKHVLKFNKIIAYVCCGEKKKVT